MNELPAGDDALERWTATPIEIWKRRRSIAIAALLLPLSASLGVAAFLPSVYRSAALVEIEHKGPDNGGDAASATVEAQLGRLNEENLSRSHLQTLIERFDLYPQLRRRGAMEGAIAQMRRDTQIEIKDQEHIWGRSTVAFQVSFRGANPERVAKVANSLASFYVESSEEQGEAQARIAVASLESQVAETKARLVGQEKQVNDFIALHLQELPEQERMNLSTLDRLNSQLASLNRRNRSSGLRDSAPSMTSTAAMTPDESATEMDRLIGQLNVLRGQVTEQHPDVRRLKAEIAALAATQARHPRPVVSASASSNDAALAQPSEQLDSPSRSRDESSQRLRQAIADTEQKVYNSPMREQELQSLQAPLAITRQLYATQVARLAQAQEDEKEQKLEPFRVLDPAVASRDPAGPNRLKIAAGGIFLSLILALLVTFLAEKLDTSFHSLDELRAFTRVPILASVPNIVVPNDSAQRRSRARWVAAAVALAAASSVGASYLLVHNNEAVVWMLGQGRA